VGWLKKYSYPKFSELTVDYSDAFLKEGVPSLWLISNIKTRDTSYHKAFKLASEQVNEDIVFLTTGYGVWTWQDGILEHMGIKKDMLPLLMLM
jgi:hypothetical protein